MSGSQLNDRIIARGNEIFAGIAREKPSLFSAATWTGKVMQWSMQNEAFRNQLFRFVDVFPVLHGTEPLIRHIHEYFGAAEELPPVLASGARLAGKLGRLGGSLLAKTIAANIREMARQFIIGETSAEAARGLKRLHNEGFTAVVDVLGEATLSYAEAEAYLDAYLELLDTLVSEQGDWSLPKALSDAPRINLAVKPSALFCLADPMDFEGSVEGILAPLRRLTEKVVAAGAFLCIDMESHRFKGITIEVYRRLKAEYRDYPHLGLALQAYLVDSEDDLAAMLDWAGAEKTSISIRLVKGAYWDYETVRARQMGWPLPVRTCKADTDAAFERMAATILRHHELCHFACASHNIRSIAAVLEIARELQVPESRYEFQMLYGMAEPVRRGILAVTGRVRLYCPYGAMVPGMGYLVRRLLENTSNESFLRQTFADEAALEQLLEDPVVAARRCPQPSSPVVDFTNEPAADFTSAKLRRAFPEAIAAVRKQAGQIVPLLIGGEDRTTATLSASVNPNRPDEVLGQVCQAGADEVKAAIAAAGKAFAGWSATPVEVRSAVLRHAAVLARERLVELAAWQVLEIGKQWDQAYADVTEAIDFLNYYALQMQRLDKPSQPQSLPGEDNRLFYRARGVAAVIAPWNFPLAISCGMVAAALVAGNSVVYKPSGLTPVTGRLLVDLLQQAGLPAGVLNFVPGPGNVIGDLLVEHPDVAQIAFTGSLEVGARIVERAARLQPGQRQFKRVIAELGGKNAIIIDDDADLDEAVPQVLKSAFGFSGQKCSACSRVIVVEAIRERFVARLVEAAQALRIGPSKDPAFACGALAEPAARQRILDYIEIGKREGELLYQSPVPDGDGYFVPLAIFDRIVPQHRLAQEEVFGPVLSILRATDFDQALQLAGTTRFALTGGLFSRSPEHIAQARREFAVGNLYLNRAITGALVGRQPFGGFALSGLGTKAGGQDYLLHFLDPCVITENSMRRGYAPE